MTDTWTHSDQFANRKVTNFVKLTKLLESEGVHPEFDPAPLGSLQAARQVDNSQQPKCAAVIQWREGERESGYQKNLTEDLGTKR